MVIKSEVLHHWFDHLTKVFEYLCILTIILEIKGSYCTSVEISNHYLALVSNYCYGELIPQFLAIL